jgi:membrane protease YdiL (CAAX protease family)
MMIEEQGGVAVAEHPQQEGPGWGWRELGAALALTIVAALLLSIVARASVAALGIEAGNALVSPTIYLLGVGVYLAVILGVYLFAARKAGWAALGLRQAPWSSFALVGPFFILEILGLALVNGLIGFLAGGFENPQVDSITGGQALSPRDLIMLLVLVAGLVPFAEELFFRGMLYPLLRSRMGPLAAIVANAALFSLAHFIPLLIPGLFVVGLFLAYLRERSGSIWPSVCLHALQNSLALVSIAAALANGSL